MKILTQKGLCQAAKEILMRINLTEASKISNEVNSSHQINSYITEPELLFL